MIRSLTLATALFGALAAVFAAPVFAAPARDSAGISIELNRLAQRDGACEASLVVANPGDQALSALRLDLVVFDREGVIARRLAVDLSPVRANKTTVKAFLLSGLDCGAVGRLLLNDILSCEDEDGPREGCVDDVATSARGELEFVK